jgi:hypothetical protein
VVREPGGGSVAGAGEAVAGAERGAVVIGACLLWAVRRLAGESAVMTDEMFAGIVAAIREDSDRMGL